MEQAFPTPYERRAPARWRRLEAFLSRPSGPPVALLAGVFTAFGAHTLLFGGPPGFLASFLVIFALTLGFGLRVPFYVRRGWLRLALAAIRSSLSRCKDPRQEALYRLNAAAVLAMLRQHQQVKAELALVDPEKLPEGVRFYYFLQHAVAFQYTGDVVGMRAMVDAAESAAGDDAQDPRLAAVLENVRAIAEMWEGRDQDALARLEGIGTDELDVETRRVLLNNMAWASLLAGRHPQRALEWALEAHRLGPDFPEMRSTLGCAMIENGQVTDRARELVVEAVESVDQYSPRDRMLTLSYAVRALRAAGKHSDARDLELRLRAEDQTGEFLERLAAGPALPAG